MEPARPALADETPAVPTSDAAQPSTQVVTNDEFDAFLAERAVVGPQRSSTRSAPGAPRQMQNMATDNTPDQLFAL